MPAPSGAGIYHSVFKIASMKTFILLILACILFSFTAEAKPDYYYYKNERVYLEQAHDRILVKFSKTITPQQYQDVVRSLKAFNVQADDDTSKPHQYNVFILNSDNTIDDIATHLLAFGEVLSASPMYKLGRGYFACTDEVSIRLPDNNKAPEMAMTIATKYGCTAIRQVKFTDAGYILSFPKGRDILEIANEIYENGDVTYSEPNFISYKMKHTNDTYYGDQWPLKNTTNPGADIHAEDAWNITKGKSSIKIAVVDDGIQLHHPDLEANLLPGYSVTGTTSVDGEATAEHGTNCAGIIGAIADNNIGITGVCPACKLIPVCAYEGNYASPDMEAEGINWAAIDGGADIISCSWHEVPSWQIDQAIDDAVNYGRNGLGCVLLFSSGNDNQNTVNYPSSSSSVISVGASTMSDERWSSGNYGSELDVVAPGGTSNITTTTINNAYIYDFNGTSAACPHAAGVMGLILSVNPCLNWSDAATVLKLSCDKINECNEQFSTNGWDGRNDKVGFGRVNAARAVNLALNYDNYFHGGSADLGIINNFSQWILTSGHCFPAASYFTVEQHKVEATFTLPYAQTAPYSVVTNGISGANPNNGAAFFTSSVNGNQVTLQTFTYFIKYNAQSQLLNVWYPAAPADIWFAILPTNASTLYFQNRTENNLANVYRTFDKIWAGYSVTAQIAYGDYILNNNDDVKFISAQSVNLMPGFLCKNNNTFLAMINGFNTCAQYPDALHKNAHPTNDSLFSATITEINVSPDLQIDSIDDILLFPNPASDKTYLEYRLSRKSTVSIRLTNALGQDFSSLIQPYELIQSPGKYRVMIHSGQLIPGIYFCTASIDGNITSRRFVVH
jgi:subtilisin family serine protease